MVCNPTLGGFSYLLLVTGFFSQTDRVRNVGFISDRAALPLQTPSPSFQDLFYRTRIFQDVAAEASEAGRQLDRRDAGRAGRESLQSRQGRHRVHLQQEQGQTFGRKRR